MSSFNERNAPRNASKKGWKPHTGQGRPRSAEKPSDDWLWGWHAVEAALGNPERTLDKLLATAERARQVEGRFPNLPPVEIVDNNRLTNVLPQGAVHQGIALKTPPLDSRALADFALKPGAVLLMLDQVTDPQNVGAILRSATAFGAAGMVLQDRNAPTFTGALAKAAAGAIERTPVARVVNLSRALEELSDLGWRTVGLAGEAEQTLAQAMEGNAPTVIVLGSEGDGLRRLVAEHCDELARIPMPGGFESLNVSAAAAIALYEASRA